MRRVIVLAAVAGCAVLTVAPRAQQPDSPASAGQQPFRTGVDVIRLDVSVLDDDRRPIAGLTAADFTVKEEGKVQRIVAVTEVDATADDPQRSSWMRHVVPDIAYNDLGDQLADGRAVALVVDDRNMPWDSIDIRVAAREVARYIIDSLSPSDVGAVVFAESAGKTQDFTHDRARLLGAIDQFPSERPPPTQYLAEGQTTFGGDIQTGSYILARHKCLRAQPIVTTLRTVVSRLASVPNQRKSIFLLSVGAPVKFMQGPECQGVIYLEMKDTFRMAQRANVNIHGIDPAGYGGYRAHLANPRITRGRFYGGMDPFAARQRAGSLQDYLQEVADQTGGRAVISAPDTLGEVDEIFAESSSYYLIGYETSNGKPDGKFRKVEVKVNRPGAHARTQKGYWAPDSDSVLARRRQQEADRNDLNLSGMMPAPKLALRLAAHPVAPANASGEMIVAATLTVRLPPLRAPTVELVRVIRTIYDRESRPLTPSQDERTIPLTPIASEPAAYDLASRFSLPPGRYEVRLNTHSRTADAGSSVYAIVEVPDIVRSPLSLSGLVLAEGGEKVNPFADVIPVVPSTAREFTRNDKVTAFLRLFQGASTPIEPVDVDMRLLNTASEIVLHRAESIAADDFANRTADFQFSLPLSSIPGGLYLLSVTARRPGAAQLRRDVVIHVR